jgi:hypothetical protein
MREGCGGGRADEPAHSLSSSRTPVTPTASASPLAQDNTSRGFPPLCSISRQPIWAGARSDNFTRWSRDPPGSKRRQMHTLSLPNSFSTGTILETHSAYLQGLIKLASSSLWISSLIHGRRSRRNVLAFCLKGLKPDLIGSQCSAISRLNPGISV